MTTTERGPFARLLYSLPAIALSVSLFGCRGFSPEDGDGLPEARDPNEPGVFEVGPNQYEAVIVAFEGGFDPFEIQVPVGAQVHFRLRSADVSHGFMIDGTDVGIPVDPLEPGEATYTFTESGEYPLYCHIYCGGGHPAMLGKVIVD